MCRSLELEKWREMLILVGTPWDKFAHFRTRKWTIDWALHVHCARNSHKRGIVSLYARLDVLLRVVDILQRQSSPAPAEERGAVEECKLSVSCFSFSN